MFVATCRFSPKSSVGNLRTFSTASPSKSVSKSNSKTLKSAFEEKVTAFEHKDVFRHVPSNTRWTYFELKKNVDSLAHGLLSAQLKNKQKLAVLLNNQLESMVVHLGCVRADVVSTFGPEQLGVEQLDKLLKTVKPSGVILNTTTTKVKTLDQLIVNMPYHNGPVSRPWQYPSVKFFWHTNFAKYNGMDWLGLWNNLRPVPDRLKIHEYTSTPSDGAVVHVNSNSESKEYSHEQVLSLANSIGEKLGLGLTDRVCVAPSLSSFAAQVAGFWAPFQFGAVSVVPCNEYNVEGVARAIMVEKCTILVGFEDQVKEILASPKLKDSSSTLRKALVVSEDAKPVRVIDL